MGEGKTGNSPVQREKGKGGRTLLGSKSNRQQFARTRARTNETKRNDVLVGLTSQTPILIFHGSWLLA